MGRLRTVTLPDWPQLRERMLAPKPPIAFTAYAIGRDPLKVRYDGDGTFRIAETGTQLVGEAWITSAIEPQRFVRLRDAARRGDRPRADGPALRDRGGPRAPRRHDDDAPVGR